MKRRDEYPGTHLGHYIGSRTPTNEELGITMFKLGVKNYRGDPQAMEVLAEAVRELEELPEEEEC